MSYIECDPWVPVIVMSVTELGGEHLGFVLGWRDDRVLADWSEGAGLHYRHWLPAAAVRRRDATELSREVPGGSERPVVRAAPLRAHWSGRAAPSTDPSSPPGETTPPT